MWEHLDECFNYAQDENVDYTRILLCHVRTDMQKVLRNMYRLARQLGAIWPTLSHLLHIGKPSVWGKKGRYQSLMSY